MLTYLRFTPREYRTIARACRSLALSDSFYPAFKAFLVQALTDQDPDLAGRIAQFRKYQVGILYEGLKERRRSGAGHTRPGPDGTGPDR